jgi:Ca-activated chloride channel homolog
MKTLKINNIKRVIWSLAIITISYLAACSQTITDKQNEETTDKTLSPYFIVLAEEGETEQLPLKSTNVEVSIAGVIADVKVNQVYSNTGNNPIEAIYVFPASTRAAVYNMVMKINDREIVAIVEEKGKARVMYETAKEEGKTASLLEEHRPNVFQMNVANIMPGATVEVSLSYTELLIPTDKVYEFVYPTVVGPRYVSGGEIETNTAESWTSNPYLEEGEKSTTSLNINLLLSAGMPIKDIKCTSHENEINYVDKTTASVVLKDNNGGNRDFVVQYRLAGNNIESGVLLYTDLKGEQYFLAMMQPPKSVESNQVPPREYVFIVDVSGSMSGFPLDVSKELMKNLLSSLNPTDRFNIVFFAGSASIYAENSLPATSNNINSAINFMNNNHGGGGTELLNALETAMTLNSDENFSRSFLIITDGYVTVEKETFDYIRNNLGNANFFSFGIGSSVNRFLIEGMAHVGYSEPFIALNQHDAQKEAKKFAHYISQPVLTNIEFKFNNFDAYDVLPDKMPDLFAERPLIISGKYHGEAAGTIEIKGVTGNEAYSKSWDIKENTADSKKAIKYLWAREKIRLLSDYNNLQYDEQAKEEIVSLGKTYNLLTEYTSFIAIDSDISNPTSNLTTVKQALPLPQGVSNAVISKSVIRGYGTVNATKRKEILYSEVAETEYLAYDVEPEVDEEIVFVVVEEMPKFQGSDIKAFQKYIQSKVVYPAKAKSEGISGKVFVSFTVDESGKVTDIEIVRSIHTELDNEVIRVIKSSPIWTPGKQGGKAVKVTYTIPISFELTN